MKKLDQVMPDQKQLRRYTLDSEQKPDSNKLALVWLRLGQLYGRGLYREHGEEPNELWSAAIHKLSDDEIRRGFTRLADMAMSFPPNVGQFVDACKHIPESRPWSNPNQNMGLVEDQREPGTKSFAQWKKENDL